MTTRLDPTWFAMDAYGAPYVAHLLTNSWDPRRGGSRPSACGNEQRRSWRRRDSYVKPEAFALCPECAALLAPPAVPSGPRHDPIACTPALPPAANTQAARVARRVAFRESCAPESSGYIPPENSLRPQGVRLTDRFNT